MLLCLKLRKKKDQGRTEQHDTTLAAGTPVIAKPVAVHSSPEQNLRQIQQRRANIDSRDAFLWMLDEFSNFDHEESEGVETAYKEFKYVGSWKITGVKYAPKTIYFNISSDYIIPIFLPLSALWTTSWGRLLLKECFRTDWESLTKWAGDFPQVEQMIRETTEIFELRVFGPCSAIYCQMPELGYCFWTDENQLNSSDAGGRILQALGKGFHTCRGLDWLMSDADIDLIYAYKSVSTEVTSIEDESDGRCVYGDTE